MASMKDHMSQFHRMMHAHHSKMRNHFQNLADCCEGEMKKCAKEIADEHESQATDHEHMKADLYRAAEDELEKSTGAFPAGISSVIVGDNPASAFTAIPRHGAPALDVNKNVPQEFAHLIKVEGE